MSHPNYAKIIQQLETVYDPEVPLIDIYTLGLIYKISIVDALGVSVFIENELFVNQDDNPSGNHMYDEDEGCKIIIDMTFTTPACPMGDAIKQMIKNSLASELPEYEVVLGISFDPMWNPNFIKDDDLQRMFM